MGEVEKSWLAAYADAFWVSPEVEIFCGSSLPVLEEPAVTWFRTDLHVRRDLIALRRFGPEPVSMSLAHGHVPFGLNYGVRADVQARFLYDVDLGVAPGRRISGEEVDFYERVTSAGYSGLCLPGPVVFHHIPISRQTHEYVRACYHSAGETSAILRFRSRPHL
jgi:glucosyl-dolichyl phosphate glucuronosyltransferase